MTDTNSTSKHADLLERQAAERAQHLEEINRAIEDHDNQSAHLKQMRDEIMAIDRKKREAQRI